VTTTERIQALQARLGLVADGIIGPATLTAIERLIDGGERGAAAPRRLTCSEAGLDWIVRFEISSETFYSQRLKRPYWPGGASGVTIGIGYDLGYTSPAQCRRDWKGLIDDRALAALEAACRLKGDDAAAAIDNADLREVSVPIHAARRAFFTASLPYHASRCLDAYPGVERLPADAQTALLSLVFNRGTRKSGARRREMKALEPLVRDGDLEGMAEQFIAMKRLWADTNLTGLLARRDKEAELLRGARRDYAPGELIEI
jgi:hypothetical protein